MEVLAFEDHLWWKHFLPLLLIYLLLCWMHCKSPTLQIPHSPPGILQNSRRTWNCKLKQNIFLGKVPLFMFCLPETLILLYILYSFLMGDIICLLSALMLDEVNTHYLFTKHPLIMSASTRIDDFSSGKYLMSWLISLLGCHHLCLTQKSDDFLEAFAAILLLAGSSYE